MHTVAVTAMRVFALVAFTTSASLQQPPRSFDLRSVNGSRNFLGPVRNHHLPLGSSCASCWAVNTATVLAARVNLARARSGLPDLALELSAQYLLNCVPGQARCGYPGSAGAAMAHVLRHGVPSESCAPWQNAKLPCDALHLCAGRHPNGTFFAVQNPSLHHLSSVTTTAAGDVQAMQAAVLDGPIACGIHAEGILSYRGGVLVDDGRGKKTDDHSVAVVGWGEEHNVEYWLVQNNCDAPREPMNPSPALPPPRPSRVPCGRCDPGGTEWGEGGFLRMQRGVDLLGIEGGCHVPRVDVVV